jgi:hypothetical protein
VDKYLKRRKIFVKPLLPDIMKAKLLQTYFSNAGSQSDGRIFMGGLLVIRISKATE